MKFGWLFFIYSILYVKTALGGEPLSFAPIVKKAAPAVVNIQVVRVATYVNPFEGDPFFQFFFGGDFDIPHQVQETSAGSGNVISEDGYILTCAHVVAGGKIILVKLVDGRVFKAHVMYENKIGDIAILKMDAPKGTDFPHLVIGDSEGMEVGDRVLAIGYPFGINQTVTSGIISSKGQRFRDQSVLQTDAAVNPGNSGGALINTKGELIGLPNAILSKSGAFHGIGFAIPSSFFKELIQNISSVANHHTLEN